MKRSICGIAIPGRRRAGLALTPRGEFSIVIAGPFLARIPDTAWFRLATHRQTAAALTAERG
ncbi:hypothetical protein [Luethyella okanaganae]|uniref:Uncharacterized protein n=1 Tax=Luethyella okanaganae TaxID=69372 RepID=A0ABW1VKC5_9MICO